MEMDTRQSWGPARGQRRETISQGCSIEVWLGSQEYYARSSHPSWAWSKTWSSTKLEEDELVKWIIEMSAIGYGQCHQKVHLMVKKILDRDRWEVFKSFSKQLAWKGLVACFSWTLNAHWGHPTYFKCAGPRHEHLRLWINVIKTTNSFYVSYMELWWERFAMCPRSNRVLAPQGTKNVYYSTSSESGQITTLACVSATGNTIHPMHVFPGIRFSNNPMLGCVDSAYLVSPQMHNSMSGWQTISFPVNVQFTLSQWSFITCWLTKI